MLIGRLLRSRSQKVAKSHFHQVYLVFLRHVDALKQIHDIVFEVRNTRAARQVIEWLCIDHLFDLSSKFFDFTVILSLANNIHHVVEDISHHFNLVVWLCVWIDRTYALLAHLPLITFWLLMSESVYKVSNVLTNAIELVLHHWSISSLRELHRSRSRLVAVIVSLLLIIIVLVKTLILRLVTTLLVLASWIITVVLLLESIILLLEWRIFHDLRVDIRRSCTKARKLVHFPL